MMVGPLSSFPEAPPALPCAKPGRELRSLVMTEPIPLKAKRPRARRTTEPQIDIERIVWDPEYRARVRDDLNKRARPARHRPTRKAS